MRMYFVSKIQQSLLIRIDPDIQYVSVTIGCSAQLAFIPSTMLNPRSTVFDSMYYYLFHLFKRINEKI